MFINGVYVVVLVLLFVIVLVAMGVKVVPQSKTYVIERFGRYRVTFSAGLNFLVPFIDRVAHRVNILERQLPQFVISVITRDNVEVDLEATVFFRVVDAARTVYRISDIDQALHTASTSIVRSAAGRLELDQLQSSRDSMAQEIEENLQKAAEIWGVEVTRTEITDVIVDESTKEAQRQQLNAERKRRAVVAEAEGEKRSKELAADAELYEAQKQADAVRIRAEADAYAIEVEAKANAEQTRLIAEAIRDGGQPAIDYDIMKRQVQAVGEIASSDSSKTIVLPASVTSAIGTLSALAESFKKET